MSPFGRSFLFASPAWLHMCTAQATESFFFAKYTPDVKIAIVRFASAGVQWRASTAIALLPSSVCPNKKKKTFFRLAWLSPPVFYLKKSKKKKKKLI